MIRRFAESRLIATAFLSACLFTQHAAAVEVVVSNVFGHCSLVYDADAVFPRHAVTTSFSGITTARAVDLDGDMDADVVAASPADGDVVWWQNNGGGTNWTQHNIRGGLARPESIQPADIDGNGTMDVAAALWFGDEILWMDNRGGGTNWVSHSVDATFDGAIAVCVVDVDGDTHRDIVGAAFQGSQIAWWRNVDGSGTNWQRGDIAAGFENPFTVHADDLDDDGDMDVVSAAWSTARVAWWENLDGTGTSWRMHTIDNAFTAPYVVSSADVDSDGDRDVVAAAATPAAGKDDVVWWENLSGKGDQWARHAVVSSFDYARGLRVMDVDRDGDEDMIVASPDTDDVIWMENQDSRGLSWRRRNISVDFNGARTVDAGDFDGDLEPDILAGSETAGLSWWENPITNRVTFLPPVDTQTVAVVSSVRLVITNTPIAMGTTQYLCTGWTGTGDVPGTGSGSLPVVGPMTLSNDTSVTWHWQTRYRLTTAVVSNGMVDTFSGWHAQGSDVVINAAAEPLHVFREWTGTVPLSNRLDNPLQLTMDQAHSVTAVFSEVDNKIFASAGENGSMNPTGTVGVADGGEYTFYISPNPHYHVEELLVDGLPEPPATEYTFSSVTNDHTLHVTFALNNYALTITNQNGDTHLLFGDTAQFATRDVSVGIPEPQELHAADLDGDGDNDLLATTGPTNTVIWWRNEGGGTSWSMRHAATNITAIRRIAPGDYDRDTDTDLAVISQTNGLVWLVNPGGGTNWVSRVISTNASNAGDLTAVDLDGDSTRDLVAVSPLEGTILWWRNDLDSTNWLEQAISTNVPGATALSAGDIDSDGHPDCAVGAAGTGAVTWWRNTFGDASQWEAIPVGTLSGVSQIRLADVDGDGVTDVIGSSPSLNRVIWWRNADVDGRRWIPYLVDAVAPGIDSLRVEDIDFDGDTDIVGALRTSHTLTWWENRQVEGLGWDRHDISDTMFLASSALVADINGDGEPDMASTAWGGWYIAWWENQTTGRVILTSPVTVTNFLYGTTLRSLVPHPVAVAGQQQDVVLGWTGTGSVPTVGALPSTQTIIMEENSSLSWNWSRRYWVRLTAGSNGTLTHATGWYNEGTNLALGAESETNYVFAGWSGDVGAQDRYKNPFVVGIDAPRLLTAAFTSGDFLVVAESGPDGITLPEGVFGVAGGVTQAVAFLPDTGFAVETVVVDGVALSPRAGVIFTNVATGHVVWVTFEQETTTTDSDNDGLPNVDEEPYGTDRYDPDTDDDGFGDYAEAVAGTAGNNSNSFFTVQIAPDDVGNRIVVSWQSATGRVYNLWRRDALNSGDWQPAPGQTNRPGTGTMLSYTNTLPIDAAHFRPGVRFAD